MNVPRSSVPHGSKPRSRASQVLLVALLALTALYAWWFGAQPDPWVALVVFALPPAWLAAGVLRRWRTAGYWAGVLALAWFCHGVMVAWTRPPERALALIEVVLALVVVFAANMPGLRARFGKKRA